MTDRATTTPDVLRFRDIELDVRSGTLRRNGTTITLAEQPLHLLTALLERPGELVTRDELRQKLWPADTFVDFEHGLNAAVKRLRTALGDSADSPTFIETVPRRGYRFLVPLEAPTTSSGPSGDIPDVTGINETMTPSLRHGISRNDWQGYALAALIAASAAGLWWWLRADASRPSSTAQAPSAGVRAPAKRLTFGAGLQTNPTWSPDGRRLAYASDAEGNFDIWVQSMDGGAPLRLTSTPEPDTWPAWSPAGDQIVFRSEHDGGGLFVVAATGGPARRLTSIGTTPAWLPDGRHIVFGNAADDLLVRLYTVAAGGGEPPHEVLADFLKDGGWYSFAPHPDGRISLIGVHRAHRLGLFTLALDGSKLTIDRPRLDGWQGPYGISTIRWDRSGANLYLAAVTSGVPTVWRIPSTGGALDWTSARRLTDGVSSAVSPSLSARGQLAFTNQRELVRAWAFPFDTASGRVTGEGRPVTDEDLRVGALNARTDGDTIAFVATRLGEKTYNAFLTDLETGSTRHVAHDVTAALLSPDGRRLAYLLERMPTDASTASRPPVDEMEYSLAIGEPDGSQRQIAPWSQRVAMILTDWTSDGRYLLGTILMPPHAGTAVLGTWPVDGLSPEPGRILIDGPRHVWQAKFSPNGRWISLVAERADPGTGVDIAVVPASGAPEAQWITVAGNHRWADKPRWAPAGRGLYFISQGSSSFFNVWGIQMNPDTGRPIGAPFQVTRFDSPALIIDPFMSRCEIALTRRYLVLSMQSASGSIWMLPDATH